MAVTLAQISNVKDPLAKANSSYINALYQFNFGRNATAAEVAKFSGRTVKDAANLVLGAKSPFVNYKAPAATPSAPTAAPSIADQLQEPYKSLYNEMKANLDRITQNGQIVNPAIEITPEQTAAFMAQAAQEIHPYYADQLKIAKDQFLTGLGYSAEDIAQQEQNAVQEYKKTRESISANAAETGFALSGQRIQQEQQAATSTQQQLDNARKNFNRTNTQAAQNFAGQYGSAALAGLDTPKIGAAPKVGTDGIELAGMPNSPLYQLSPDIYGALQGSQVTAEKAAQANRASELEGIYRSNQALSTQRQLTI